MPYCALGQWQWRDLPQPHWDGPAGALERLDLRTLAECARLGGPGGLGLFWFAADPTGAPGVLHLLGDDPAGAIRDKATLEIRLGFALAAARIDRAVWEIMTDHTDPVGLGFAKPLMPGTADTDLKLGFGPVQIAEPFDIRHHAAKDKVLAVLRNDYATRRAFDRARGSTQYLKILGALTQKYPGLDYRLVQDRLPDEPPRAPATTISENFNTADSDTLGPQLTWLEYVGDTDVVSNRARCVATGRGRAEADVSSDDNYVEFDAIQSTALNFTTLGPLGRYSTAALTNCYQYIYVSFFGADLLAKFVDDVSSTLATSAAQPRPNPALMRITCDGSAINGKRDGTVVVSVTDTTHTGYTRGGYQNEMNDAGEVVEFDNYQAADLSAGSPFVYRRRQQRIRAKRLSL